MRIGESAENYLETILILCRKRGSVKSVDVASYMGFSKPSISVAVKNLREEGYISVGADGELTLLEPGMKIAEKIYERHCLIAEMLMALGVDEETAFADSCKIEHVISEESFRCLKRHMKNNLRGKNLRDAGV